MIDAKSIMGVLSTAIGEVSKVEIHTDNVEVINKFKEEMKLWTIAGGEQ